MPAAFPIGSRRLNHYGYVQIKTAMGLRRWPFEHRVVWEQRHGPLPQGHIVHHLNGDRADNRIENLQSYASNSAHFLEHHSEQSREIMRAVGRSGKGKPKPPGHGHKVSVGLKKAKALPAETQGRILALRSDGLSMYAIALAVFGQRASVGRVFRFLHSNH